MVDDVPIPKDLLDLQALRNFFSRLLALVKALNNSNILTLFDSSVGTAYSEYTYSSTLVVRIDVWDTYEKGLYLFEKRFVYDGTNLVSETITDKQTKRVLTKTYVYSGSLVVTTKTVLS